MATQKVVPFSKGREDFLIRCDGCNLPARWLDQAITEEVKARVRNVHLLVVDGSQTPSGNLKYLPAKAGIHEMTADGYEGKLIALGSGNFAESSQVVLQEEGRSNKLTAVVPNDQPAGKRLRLERRGITIKTELELHDELGADPTESSFAVLKRYAARNGYRILDQYDCFWNKDSYLLIPMQVIGKIGPVSEFNSTAGTKGKFHIGDKLKRKRPGTHLVVVYPPHGQKFPGGRNKLQGLLVANQFEIKPTAEMYVDELVAYKMIGELYPNIALGVTAGAEIGAAMKYLLQMDEEGRIEELRLDDGSIVVLVVASDSIYPYVAQGMKYFPQLFDKITAHSE